MEYIYEMERIAKLGMAVNSREVVTNKILQCMGVAPLSISVSLSLSPLLWYCVTNNYNYCTDAKDNHTIDTEPWDLELVIGFTVLQVMSILGSAVILFTMISSKT